MQGDPGLRIGVALFCFSITCRKEIYSCSWGYYFNYEVPGLYEVQIEGCFLNFQFILFGK